MKTGDETVFIIDDDLSVCNALCALFESVHFNVKAYNNAHAFLENEDYLKAGCLIVDVRMPFMSGLQLLEHLSMLKSTMPVLMITGYGDVHMAVRAMKLGAVDFILKPFNDQSLLESVQHYIHKEAKTKDISKQHKIESIANRLKKLSEREAQVLELITEGKLNKEIAQLLFISMSTVEVHRANIMRKMQVKNLAQLLKLYIEYQVYTEC